MWTVLLDEKYHGQMFPVGVWFGYTQLLAIYEMGD